MHYNIIVKQRLLLLFIIVLLNSCKQTREIRKLNKLKTTAQDLIESSKIKFEGSYILSSKVNNKGHYSEEKPNFCVFTFFKNGEFKRSANYYAADYTKIDSLNSVYKKRIDSFSNKELKCVYKIIKPDSIVVYELYKYARKKGKISYNVAQYSLVFIDDSINISENSNLRLDKMKLFYTANIHQKK